MILNILFNIIIAPIELIIETLYTFLSIVVRYNPIFPIFGISVFITIICLPLYSKAEIIQANERSIQERMKNKIAIIKKNFKGDEKYMILSMYYRENHYHPLMSLRSAISLLIQIPFFIAAYHFISNLESLKGTTFFLINDLSKPDKLLYFKFFHVNILPVIMTFINIISAYIYSKNFLLKDKIQLYGMSVFFLILLYNSPSALVIYWTFNNIFSLLKNIIMKFKNPVKIFYYTLVFSLICASIYVLFFRSQGKSGSIYFKIASLSVTLFIVLIPFIINIFNKFFEKYFIFLKNHIKNLTKLFIFTSLSLWLLSALIIPLNIISSDITSFSFLGHNSYPISLISTSAFICLGIFIFWPLFIFFTFSDKTKIILFFINSIVLIYGIINVFIFFGQNGILSQSLIFLSDTALQYSNLFIILNIIAFIIIAYILFIIVKYNKINYLSSFYIILIFTGMLISCWKIVSINKEYRTFINIKQNNEGKLINNDVKDNTNIQYPIINLSKTQKNVIVIMLDRAIGSYFPLILDERPELFSDFSGFVYYPNTISFFRSTILGAPPIFGGYEYTPEGFHKRNNISMQEKNDEALLLMPCIFKNIGFETSVFDLPNVNYQDPMNIPFFKEKNINANILEDKFYDKFINEFPEKAPNEYIDYDKLLGRNFVFFSFLSISAPSLRKIIYKNGNYWASISTSEDNSVSPQIISVYAALYYLPEISSFSDNNNTLTLLVNDLPHAPSFLQYPDYTIVSEITDFGPNRFNNNIRSQKHYHVNTASYLLLARWFKELRNNNVYNNSRIIIVSDHDEFLIKPLFTRTLNNINTFYNPILLVKDFNETENLKTDMTFMTTADVPLIAVKDIIDNPKNPFTGNPLKPDKENGVNIYLGGSAYPRDYPGWESLEKTSHFYHVKDNIFDENNWTKITKNFNE